MKPFESLQNQWTGLIQQITQLTDRVTELENRLDVLAGRQQPLTIQSPQAPAPQAPAPGAPAPGPYAPPPGATVAAPPTVQAPTPAAPPPQAAPGPQSVPTYEQLLERGMQLAQAKGEKACIDLIATYGGKDEQGTVKISLVPQDKYAALFADFGAQLGLH